MIFALMQYEWVTTESEENLKRPMAHTAIRPITPTRSGSLNRRPAMKTCVKISLLVGALCICGAAWAAPKPIACPTEIPETSIRLERMPKQWTPHVLAPLYLSSAVATAGPPEMLAVLMGESTWRKGVTEWSTTYAMRDDGFPDGKWLECRYGEHGQVALSMRLDDQTQVCTLRFSKGENAGQTSVKIVCK
jgi:hypothetical protein